MTDGASSKSSAAASGTPRDGSTLSGSPNTQGDASDNPIGKTIQGRYLVKRLLGEGGMGGVYEAEHLEIGRRVALKLVHTEFARNEQIAARLKQEARSTGSIESAHIVQVFDAGDDPQLGLYLVMELLHGDDMGRMLESLGQLPVTVACGLVLQAARGLSRAHAAKIVHRDLKPANIFVCKQDDGSALVKLVDFGIAKMLRDAQDAATGGGLTRVGLAIGTPQYMSPEQAQGLPNVDRRTDIYSLGAVLYEAITGKPPYDRMATYEQTILQIMTKPAPRLKDAALDVPPEVDELCARMMAFEPDARFLDMAAVAEALVAVFPELETSSVPYRVLEVGSAQMVVGRQASSPSIFERPPARLTTGAGVRRAPTMAGVALTPADGAHDDQPAGVPRKGRGVRILGGLAVGATALAVAVLATLGHRGSAVDTPHGMVQAGQVGQTGAIVPPVAAPVTLAPPEPLTDSTKRLADPAPVVTQAHTGMGNERPTHAPRATTLPEPTSARAARNSATAPSTAKKLNDPSPASIVTPTPPAAPAVPSPPTPKPERVVGAAAPSTEY